ncbi:hypothetical protein EVAR_97119_1 [Eumeta japonica]|uniref:Uncharacterized protein n=1 Tax=Eumeta variegata TaxID=151549 RepID=A0A4C1WSK0_EUMVA|nr:hypothetical protein EVAR_97119_1 [Eumeta japonica]
MQAAVTTCVLTLTLELSTLAQRRLEAVDDSCHQYGDCTRKLGLTPWHGITHGLTPSPRLATSPAIPPNKVRGRAGGRAGRRRGRWREMGSLTFQFSDISRGRNSASGALTTPPAAAGRRAPDRAVLRSIADAGQPNLTGVVNALVCKDGCLGGLSLFHAKYAELILMKSYNDMTYIYRRRYMPVATCERCAVTDIYASRRLRTPLSPRLRPLTRLDGRSCAWDCVLSCLFRETNW